MTIFISKVVSILFFYNLGWDSLGVEAADDDGGEESHDSDEHSDDEDQDLNPADTGGRPHL